MVKVKALYVCVLSIFLAFLIVYAFYALYAYHISSVGEVRTVNVAVYWDYDCTREVTEIDWGMVYPSESRKVIVYVRNEGNTPSNLTLNTEGWHPQNAKEYISLSWNYENQTLSPEETIEIEFTLEVSSEIKGIEAFEFTIVITAKG